MTWRALTLSLVLLAPTLAQGQETEPPEIELDLQPGPVEVEALLHQSARSLGALAVIGSSVHGRQITLQTAWRGTFPWRAVKHVLRAHGVHAQLGRPNGEQGPRFLTATRVRQLPAPARRFLRGRVPLEPAQVTGVFSIEDGAGGSIYANLRGIVTGPHGQSPKILYLEGRPERLLVTGSRAEVRHAAHMIRLLDVAGPPLALSSLRVGATQAAQIARAIDALLQARRSGPVRDLLWGMDSPAPWARACGEYVCVAGDPDEIRFVKRVLRRLLTAPKRRSPSSPGGRAPTGK